MIKNIKINNDNISTQIIIKNNFIKVYLKRLLKNDKKVFCLIDSKLKKIFMDFVKIDNFNCFYIKCGENIKNINTFKSISNKLLEKNIDRNSVLVSIGGGTLGDLSGFIASTILRGVDYVLVPTTLLSQVDSSIGGKNGINTKFGKNLIGTFYHPKEVIIDTNFIKTLPLREIKCGYAEIVKHSLIKDIRFFRWLEKNYIHLYNLNTNILQKAIYKSILIKLWYVGKDPYEKLTNKNSRSMLNFGHTIGHALEAYYDYKKLNHGEAVSIGMIMEAKISNKLGYLKKLDLENIIKHFKLSKLKTFDKNINNNKIFNTIKKDKKNLNNNVNIILLNKIGNSFFSRNVELDLIKKIIKKI